VRRACGDVILILGVGVDIIRIQRMESAIQRGGKRFLAKVFAQRELEAAGSRTDYAVYLATRFAGKEAVFKAFGVGWDVGVKLTEIEIGDGKFGEPSVMLSGKFSQLASQRNVDKLMLTLSYDTDYAIGFAVLVGRKSSLEIDQHFNKLEI
jgi:holo-[acyl-carrier protein] synthase